MDGPNYLHLLQTGRLDPNIPEHRKVLEENLGPLGKLLNDLGISIREEEVKPAELVTEVVETVETEAPKPRNRRKKDSITSPTE